MEYLQTLLDSSSMPVLTAFILGLLTAVSPCPLATNIATAEALIHALERGDLDWREIVRG